jgi:hypothetical protein
LKKKRKKIILSTLKLHSAIKLINGVHEALLIQQQLATAKSLD